MWSSRKEFPAILNKLGLVGVGVEIGVQCGVFGSHIRRNWDGQLYIGVDPYREYPGSDVPQNDHDAYKALAIAELEATGKPWELIQLPSAGASVLLDQRYGQGGLDWVYIDGDHEYGACMSDIERYWPLLKSGGVMALHDYVLDGWHADDAYRAFATREEALAQGRGSAGPFGVREAIDDYFRFGADIYVTDPQEDGGWQSALIVKP